MKLLPSLTKEKMLAFLPWAGIYFAAGLASLTISHFVSGVKGMEILWVFLLVIPRILSLSLFAIPCQLMPYRYTGTFGMMSIWFLWIGFTNNCLWLSVILAIISIGVGLFCFFKWERKKPKAADNKALFARVTILFMLSVLIIFLLEIIQTKSFLIPFHSMIGNPDIFACNILYFTAIGSFVFWCPKQKSAGVIYLVIWLGLGIGSAYKASNLYEPLLPNDIYNAKDGIPTAIKFLGIVGTILIVIGVVFILIGIGLLIKLEKSQGFRKNSFWGCTLYFLVAFFGVIFCSNAPGMKFGYDVEAKEVFEQNGFVYSFMTYSVETIFPQESGYDKALVDQILQAIDKQDNAEYKTDVKNLIVFQLESFMDPTTIDGAEYERDPMPYLHYLQENYTSGIIEVPTYGGTTVRSEFEFLSGMNLDLLEVQGGKSFNPYTKYLNKQNVDTLVRALKQQGFGTTAVHNYQGEFFYRNDVYKNLGFDTFIPYELMSGIQKREGVIWGNDDIFVSQIDNILSASTAEKNFIFNVTVQLHGNYPSIPEEEYCMEISGIEDETLRGQIAYYVNELESVDDAIRSICAYFEERNEPTYILFYSDHLPKFAQNTAGFEASDRYLVNYFSWNNMGYEKEDENIELYRLSTKLCNTVGIKGGVMNQFHRLYSQEADYKDLLKEIQNYKFFYEHKDHTKMDYFVNDNFKIGVVPLAIESIDSDLNGGYVIKGTGFTENVWICINGQRISDAEVGVLTYVDANTMTFTGYERELTSEDVITLEVVGEKYKGILQVSLPFEWPIPDGVIMDAA